MQTEIEKRWEEFRLEGTDIELHWTVHAHTVLQRYLQFAFGVNEAVEILERHYTKAGIELEGEHAFYAPIDWMQYAPEKVRRLHVYRQLVNLRAYAVYGLPVEDLERTYGRGGIPDDVDARRSCIEELLEHFLPSENGDYLIAPTSLFGDDIAHVIDAASARWKLDSGDDTLTLAEVAAIARMRLKSVKNATAPKSSDPLPLDTTGRVPRKEAYRWLLNRRDFRDSLWRNAGHQPGASVAGAIREVGPVVFVPVARDGSWFSPLQHSDGSYRVGPPTDPDQYERFEQALEALQRMEEPRWHVPTERGWMVVTGVQWMRIPRSELDDADETNAVEDVSHV